MAIDGYIFSEVINMFIQQKLDSIFGELFPFIFSINYTIGLSILISEIVMHFLLRLSYWKQESIIIKQEYSLLREKAHYFDRNATGLSIFSDEEFKAFVKWKDVIRNGFIISKLSLFVRPEYQGSILS